MCKIVSRLIEWCFTPLSTVFQTYQGDSSHYLPLSWVSRVLCRGSEVSCPLTLLRKNPEDPVQLEPRTSAFKHFMTEPCRTPGKDFKGYKTIPRSDFKHGKNRNAKKMWQKVLFILFQLHPMWHLTVFLLFRQSFVSLYLFVQQK